MFRTNPMSEQGKVTFEIEEAKTVPKKTRTTTSKYDPILDAYLKSGKDQIKLKDVLVDGQVKTADYIRQQLLGRVKKVPRFKGIDVTTSEEIVYVFKKEPEPKTNPEPKKEAKKQ